MRLDQTAQKMNDSFPNLVSWDINGYFLEKSTPERWKYCTKICRMICSTCIFRLHVNCLPLYHSDKSNTESVSPATDGGIVNEDFENRFTQVYIYG